MEITINREIGKLGLPRHLVLGMDPGIASCDSHLSTQPIMKSWIWASDYLTLQLILKRAKVLRLFAGASALPVETLTVPRRA